MLLLTPRCPPDVPPWISAKTSFTLLWGVTTWAVFFFPSAYSQ